mmetsp:Transcript_22693/g.44075  ORF Transcript_22693/g.44075 Transcript_22693/m.44075 type:complete len:335 (-) Transcript_22693:992-1996(-)
MRILTIGAARLWGSVRRAQPHLQTSPSRKRPGLTKSVLIQVPAAKNQCVARTLASSATRRMTGGLLARRAALQEDLILWMPTAIPGIARNWAAAPPALFPTQASRRLGWLKSAHGTMRVALTQSAARMLVSHATQSQRAGHSACLPARQAHSSQIRSTAFGSAKPWVCGHQVWHSRQATCDLQNGFQRNVLKQAPTVPTRCAVLNQHTAVMRRTRNGQAACAAATPGIHRPATRTRLHGLVLQRARVRLVTGKVLLCTAFTLSGLTRMRQILPDLRPKRTEALVFSAVSCTTSSRVMAPPGLVMGRWGPSARTTSSQPLFPGVLTALLATQPSS